MEGQLSQHPLAELIREVAGARLSGVLRLERGGIKVAAYLEKGGLIFAASNLRAHRLSAFLRRNSILSESQLAELPRGSSDDEIAESIVERGIVTSSELYKIRSNQVAQVLRPTLLWTSGTWSFDRRVRLADNVRVHLDINSLLLECARLLPISFINSRFAGAAGTFSMAENNGEGDLLPQEGFVLSRATTPLTLEELKALSGLDEEQTLRAIYGLSLAGYLLNSESRPAALARSDAVGHAGQAIPSSKRVPKPSRSPAAPVASEAADLKALFARLERAADHYEVLDVGHSASIEEIKNAYHDLARNYHPDRFHQSEPELRRSVDSAFARVAQAYEALSDESSRASYDARLQSQRPASKTSSTTDSEANRAESTFQRGRAAWQQNQREEARRFLGEAAMLQPRVARYRAEYGHALIGETNSRRLAEAELQAAIALDPKNSSYRVMLAELYKHHGLRRRAEGELAQALAVDPKNEAARAQLSTLRGKTRQD